MLNRRYAHCETVTPICDNLNTHAQGAFYKGLRADAEHRGESRERTEAPSHARAAGGELRRETGAWATDENAWQRGVDWR